MIHPISESTVSTPLSPRSPITNRTHIGSCYTDASFETYTDITTALSAARLCGTTTMIMPKAYNESLSSSPVINTNIIPDKQQSSSQSSPEQLTSLKNNNRSVPSQHVKKMKVIQSSSSSLSDFLSSPSILTVQNRSKLCFLLS